MSRSRLAGASVVVLAWLGAAGFVACSTFSASDGGGGVEGGSEGGSEGSPLSEGGGDATQVPPCAAADTSCDPLNCGAAGHSCLGGACSSGACQPVVMGSSTGEAVVDVAVDAHRVSWLTSAPGGFWSNLGHVYACPLGGCAGATPQSLTGPPVSTGSLAGDGVTAYFSIPYAGDRVVQILPGGDLQIVGMHAEAVRLQMRGGALYFETLYEGATTGFSGHIFKWNGMTESVVGAWTSAHNLNDFVLVNDRAFFSGAEFLATCTIGTQSDCASPTEVIQTQGEYLSLTTDGASVFWSDGASVFSCPANAPTCAMATTVVGPASLGANARGITFDHGTLYVTTEANDLFRCSLPDCSGTLKRLVHETRLYVANEFTVGHSVAADDTAVYWAAVDGTEGPGPDGSLDTTTLVHRVMKLAK